MLGRDLLRNNLRRQTDLPGKRTIVNLQAEYLLWPGRYRFGSSPCSLQKQPARFDPKIDIRFLYSSEFKADANATFAAVGVHCRSPALRLCVASAGELIGEPLQLAVKPFEFNDFFQGMILVRPQSHSCIGNPAARSIAMFKLSTLLPIVQFPESMLQLCFRFGV